MRFFVQQAVSALSRSLGITVLSVVTIGVALTMLATFAAIVKNLGRVVDELGREVEVSAYLTGTTTPETARKYVEAIKTWPDVAAARYLTPAEAMNEFRRALGRDALILDGLPADVLPASLEVRLNPRAWTAGEVRQLAARLGRLEGVDDVRFGQEDLERLGDLLQFARVVSLVLGAALALATILIISNTIRLTVYARRDEIDIMSLVGATNAFVRAPFVIEGMFQGLLGGLIALAALFALENVLKVGLERGLSYAYGPMSFDLQPIFYLGPLVATGVLLGLVGSLLAVGRFLKV